MLKSRVFQLNLTIRTPHAMLHAATPTQKDTSNESYCSLQRFAWQLEIDSRALTNWANFFLPKSTTKL